MNIFPDPPALVNNRAKLFVSRSHKLIHLDLRGAKNLKGFDHLVMENECLEVEDPKFSVRSHVCRTTGNLIKIQDSQLGGSRSPSPRSQNASDFRLRTGMSKLSNVVTTVSGGFDHASIAPKKTSESCTYDRFFGNALISDHDETENMFFNEMSLES